MPSEAIRLFKLLCDLLPIGAAEAIVRQRLKPLTTAANPVRNQLGRTYLTLGGAFFKLTAIFEGDARNLYQVTLRVTPAAYAAIRTFARALPGAAAPPLAAAAEWQNSWLGLLPRLRLRPAAGGKGVSARFVGL
ncbi:hypothetical protein, partial [Hymenobacter sp. UV11]